MMENVLKVHLPSVALRTCCSLECEFNLVVLVYSETCIFERVQENLQVEEGGGGGDEKRIKADLVEMKRDGYMEASLAIGSRIVLTSYMFDPIE